MVICLKRSADLHTARLMPLPLTVSCFSKIQIGFSFLVHKHTSLTALCLVLSGRAGQKGKINLDFTEARDWYWLTHNSAQIKNGIKGALRPGARTGRYYVCEY